MAELTAAIDGISVEEAYDEMSARIRGRPSGAPRGNRRRLRVPLQRSHAGFISGQNLQLDGGSLPGPVLRNGSRPVERIEVPV